MRKLAIPATIAMVLGVLAVGSPASASDGSCHATGTGLTAHYVNEVPSAPLEVTCDIGIYFDADGTIDDVDIEGTVAGARSVQYGVYIDGASVDVTASSVDVADDYPHQFLAIAYRDAATGVVADNVLTGAHRVGALLDGGGTSATVRGNEIEGTGPKDKGWAENGIQVSRGASGTLLGNAVTDHWWDPNNFVSSGIIVFGSDDVTINRNDVRNNDAGVILFGDRNNAVHNTVEVTREEAETDIDTLHYGVWVSGRNNGVRQNTIAAVDGEVGIFVFAGSNNTKLIRNAISGWDVPVFDGGDKTKRPKPFRD